jgi:RNAse (barnase) inhibitor barstar
MARILITWTASMMKSSKCFAQLSFGRSLDALNDVIVGGLSKSGIGYNEAARIFWKNSEKSRQKLGKELFTQIVQILKQHGHHLDLA